MTDKDKANETDYEAIPLNVDTLKRIADGSHLYGDDKDKAREIVYLPVTYKETPDGRANLYAGPICISSIIRPYDPLRNTMRRIAKLDKYAREVVDRAERRGVCQCAARSQVDCACDDVDWRSRREVELEIITESLRKELEELRELCGELVEAMRRSQKFGATNAKRIISEALEKAKERLK